MNLIAKFYSFTLFFLLLILFVAPVMAQSTENDTTILKIYATGKSFGDSVIVRWVPGNYKVWDLGNKNGYKVERFTYSRDGEKLSRDEQVKSKIEWEEAIELAPQAFWETRMEEEVFGLAASALFGENFEAVDPMQSGMVSFYNNSKEKESKFGFGLFAADQSLEVAEAMGLSLVDKAVKKGEVYLYGIQLYSNSTGKYIESGTAMVNMDEVINLPKPVIKGSAFGDRVIQMHWENLREFYTSFNVERSSDNGLNYEQINKRPIIFSQGKDPKNNHVLYMDSLQENNKLYQYRITGRTIYDEVSPPSDFIEGMGKPAPLKARAKIVDAIEMQEGQMQIKWGFVDSLNSEIKGFQVFRAPSKGERFVQISEDLIPASERSFLDTQPNTTNYYVIKVIDNNDYELSSYPKLAQLVDHTPPVAPVELKGVLNEEDGMVTLTWSPNTDDDLKGYRVFFSNHGKGDFAQLTGAATTDTIYTYKVTMKTLSEQMYFKIVATDFHDNFSEYSEVCKVQRPDRRAPNAPAFTKIDADTKGVKLEWASSSSKDVVMHYLRRRVKASGEWENIYTYSESMSMASFLDTTAFNQLEYEYCVVAIDDANLEGTSKVLVAKPTDNFVREGIQDVSVRTNRKTKIIQLSWNYDGLDQIKEFVVYRAKKDQSISTYKVIESTSIRVANASQKELEGKIYFDDTNVAKGQEYTYRILAKHKDGGFSPLTEPVVTTFN